MMCQELGYEDEPEFEDALKGTFADFLDKLPYVVKEEKNGRWGQLQAAVDGPADRLCVC
jgi:hypothetical protein